MVSCVNKRRSVSVVSRLYMYAMNKQLKSNFLTNRLSEVKGLRRGDPWTTAPSS